MSKRLLPILRYELRGSVQPVAGEIGELLMAPIDSLVVDLTYQRGVSATSARNIERIARQFDWRRFTPVIGIRREDGRIAVIDGQHRAAAALSRDIETVPVYLIKGTLEEAAAAFAAINGAVTPMTPQDIYRAQLAAGDPEAVALQKVLDIAGVSVVTLKEGFRKGETRSINVLLRARRVYGDALLTLTLQCITETRQGNPGMIIGATVNGIALALLTKPELLPHPSMILDAFDGINLARLLDSAKVEFVRTGNSPQAVITREINAKLARLQKRIAA